MRRNSCRMGWIAFCKHVQFSKFEWLEPSATFSETQPWVSEDASAIDLRMDFRIKTSDWRTDWWKRFFLSVRGQTPVVVMLAKTVCRTKITEINRQCWHPSFSDIYIYMNHFHIYIYIHKLGSYAQFDCTKMAVLGPVFSIIRRTVSNKEVNTDLMN